MHANLPHLLLLLAVLAGALSDHGSGSGFVTATGPVSTVLYSAEGSLSPAPQSPGAEAQDDSDEFLESEEDGEEDEDEEEVEAEPGHTVEKRDLNERIRQHMSEQPHRMVNYTGCDNCRKMHIDMKQASLEHIKKYVLSFLGFNVSGPPKKAGSWPKIPEYILDQYHGLQGSDPGYTAPGDEWKEERANHQSQQRYLDMQGGGGGGGSEQDYMSDDPNWNLRMQQDEETFTPIVKTHRVYLFPNGE